MLDYAGTQIAIVNGGSIRDSIEPGDITLLDVYNLFPFLNYVCKLDVKGSDIWAEMEYSLALIGETDGGFIQVSGMTVTYDPDAEKGHRVVSIEIGGSSLDPDAMYEMATIDFIWRGGDNNRIFVNYEAESVGIVNDIFIDHIKDLGTIDDSTITGGRLVTA